MTLFSGYDAMIKKLFSPPLAFLLLFAKFAKKNVREKSEIKMCMCTPN
jgi:hypothetical protein